MVKFTFIALFFIITLMIIDHTEGDSPDIPDGPSCLAKGDFVSKLKVIILQEIIFNNEFSTVP